jgi:hypothetical protein
MDNLKIKVVKQNNQSGSMKLNAGIKVKNATATISETVKDCRSELSFKIGSKVKHKEEGICGEIKFVGSDKIAVVWEDNTRERILLSDAQEVLEYVDSAQSQVAPLVPQISDRDEDEENGTTMINAPSPKPVSPSSAAVDAALAALEEDELNEDVEVNSVNLTEIKMQRKINQLETKLTAKQTNNIKEKIAKDLVDLSIAKGIIDSDDSELEMTKILSMDDTQFNAYQKSIVEYETDGSVVTSDEEISEELDEAEIALRKIKGNGGQPIIGDFTNKVAKEVPLSGSGEKRSLGDIKDSKFTWDNQYSVPEFGDQVVSELIEKLNSRTTVAASHQPTVEKANLPGFENLQGLTKPLVVTSNKPIAAFPSNTSLKDLIGSLDWTTLKRS